MARVYEPQQSGGQHQQQQHAGAQPQPQQQTLPHLRPGLPELGRIILEAAPALVAADLPASSPLPLPDTVVLPLIQAATTSNHGQHVQEACEEGGDSCAAVHAVLLHARQFLPLLLSSQALQRLSTSVEAEAELVRMADRLLLYGKHALGALLLPSGRQEIATRAPAEELQAYFKQRNISVGRKKAVSSLRKVAKDYMKQLQAAPHDKFQSIMAASGTFCPAPGPC